MFKVINGGQAAAGGPPTDWRKLWQQLNALEKTLALRRHGGMGPRANFALLCGAGLCFGLMAVFFGLDQLGLHLRSAIFNLVPIGAGLACSFFVGSRSKRPKTWTAKLDQQLAAYEPIDREAYRHLQQRTRDLGYLESHEVHEWLGFERHAIEVAAGWRQASPDGFLSKKV